MDKPLRPQAVYKIRQPVHLGSTPQVRTGIGILILPPRKNGYVPPSGPGRPLNLSLQPR